ncbi:MAG: hypothetical protein ACRC31_06245, partial [Cetobacterium sp.]
MANAIDTLFIEFLLDNGALNKSVDKASKKLKDFATGSISILGAIAVAVKMNEIVDQFTQGADELLKFSNQLGESTEKMQFFEEVALRSGGTVNGFRSSMEKLAEKTSEASRGTGEAMEIFARLGINIRNTDGSLK